MKKKRQELMLRLISEFEIDTQDELIAKLRDHGFDVTQATVSRDIRELQITKTSTGKGTYRYVRAKGGVGNSSFRFSASLVESVLDVDHAENIVVLKTRAGMAQAVAVGIDGLNMTNVLGCVAGDDTIMIVVRSAADAASIAERLRSLIRVL